ncbi:transposable element Tc3 transposase [Trichonephila clavipes]|nr:transposable element Tc3 transposase [Trichonephila clavipes]
MANSQSVRRHLDAFTRGRIIGKLEEGRSVTSVAAEFGIAHSIVSRLWRQFQTAGTAIRGFSSGRPRGTTPADDRRLHCGGLFARRPVRCVSLTPAHRRRLSLGCREHRNWRDNEWGRVLFTDESRFSLSSDSHRILIWRERGNRNHPSNIIERDKYGGRGVLVWEGIMLGSRTDLHIFDAGSVNGTRYCNEILLPYVRLFRGAMGLQFLFMDDNAPCHRTVAAEQLLVMILNVWIGRHDLRISLPSSMHFVATPSSHYYTTNQGVRSPPRRATFPGNNTFYDMGWRLASQAICPVTFSVEGVAEHSRERLAGVVYCPIKLDAKWLAC